jgi:DNA-binding transcriptional LysR family regulator
MAPERTCQSHGRMSAFGGKADAAVSEWMFTPEIVDGRVKAVLRDWELPPIDLWAVFPAGRTASTKARTFTAFVEDVMHARPARPGRAGVSPGQ